MSDWTSPQDIIDRWVGPGAPADTDQLAALIDDAEAIITKEYPGIQDRIDSGSLNQDLVVMVVARMVTRLLRNPEGLTYWQQQTGPFGQARNFGDGGTDIWMTVSERELLRAVNRGKSFALNLAPDSVSPPLDVNTDLEDLVWRPLG